MKETILVPDELDLDNSLIFSNKIKMIDRTKREYHFNFCRLKHTCPFGLLLTAATIGDFVMEVKKNGASVFAANYDNLSYQAHMGFFKSFGLNFGNEPGEAKGSPNYLPITILSVDDLKKEALDKMIPVGEVIEKKCNKLSQILLQIHNEDDSTIFSLTYILREIMRNVVEHSKSETLSYCAQYWPTQDRAEIAIMDKGVGICNTLRRNPHLKITDDFNALTLSLMPGISGKSYKGIKLPKGEWTNTGYGLYMVSRICRNYGNFFIGSCNAGIYLGNKNKEKNDFNFGGTIVRLVINPSKIKDMKKVLEEYREEGKVIAKDIEGAITIPSVASMMLTEDFRSRKTIIEKIISGFK